MLALENFSCLDNWQDVTYKFPSHHVIFLTGENGSGKTLLFDCICGVMSEYDGNIIREETPVYLPQNVHLHGRLKVEDILQYIFESYSQRLIRARSELLGKFARYRPVVAPLLTKKMRDLSNGEKKLILFLTYSFLPSKLYLFDEPFAGMDKKNKTLCLQRLQEIATDSTIFISNHEDLTKYNANDVLDCVEIDVELIKGRR